MSNTTSTRKHPTVQTNTTFYSTNRANPQYTTPVTESTSLLQSINGNHSVPVNNKNSNGKSNGHNKTQSVQFNTNDTINDNDNVIPIDSGSPISPHSPLSPSQQRIRRYSIELASLQITRRIGTATEFQIFSFILKLCTGAGLLGLPYAFDHAGVAVSIVLTCILTVFAIVSSLILLRCREVMLVTQQHFIQSESLYDRKSYSSLPRSDSTASSVNNIESSNQSAHDSFGALAYYCMGHTGTLLVDGSLIISFLGAVAIYVITVTQLLSEVYPDIPSIYFTIGCTILLLPFALIRELTWLNGVTVLATIAYIVGFIVIFWYGFDLLRVQEHDAKLETDILSHTTHINYVYGSIAGIMSCFGILTFSLDTPTMVFMFEEEMARPEKFKSTLIVSMITVCIALATIGTLGVLLFHNTALGVQSIIISNLPSTGWITNSVKLAVAVTLLLSAPLSLSPALNLLEHVTTGQHSDNCHEPNTSAEHIHDEFCGFKQRQPWYYSTTFINIVRILVHLLVVFIAFTVPNFTFIISILGCVTFALLCYILPPLFYILLHRRDCTQLHRHYIRMNESTGKDKDWSLRTYYIFNWTYLIIGTVCSVVATSVVIAS